MVIHHLYKKSSLFLLMYFQVEKFNKPLLLKNTVIINCIYIRITVILQELYAHQSCTESTKTQESLF